MPASSSAIESSMLQTSFLLFQSSKATIRREYSTEKSSGGSQIAVCARAGSCLSIETQLSINSLFTWTTSASLPNSIAYCQSDFSIESSLKRNGDVHPFESAIEPSSAAQFELKKPQGRITMKHSHSPRSFRHVRPLKAAPPREYIALYTVDDPSF